MKTLEWDYLFDGIPNDDWNQTLVTYINVLCETPTYPKRIDVPNKFKPLIESLLLYNEDEERIGSLYDVFYITSDIDYIKIDDNKLFIKNYYGSTES